jgi:hypothetical protein
VVREGECRGGGLDAGGNPKVLAALAHRQAKAKIPQLEEALEGTDFSPRSTPSC